MHDRSHSRSHRRAAEPKTSAVSCGCVQPEQRLHPTTRNCVPHIAGHIRCTPRTPGAKLGHRLLRLTGALRDHAACPTGAVRHLCVALYGTGGVGWRGVGCADRRVVRFERYEVVVLLEHQQLDQLTGHHLSTREPKPDRTNVSAASVLRRSIVQCVGCMPCPCPHRIRAATSAEQDRRHSPHSRCSHCTFACCAPRPEQESSVCCSQRMGQRTTASYRSTADRRVALLILDQRDLQRHGGETSAQ